MKSALLSLGRKVLHPSQRVAVRQVYTEVMISYYHRRGLWQIRRKSLFNPEMLHLGSGPIRKAGFLNVDLFPGGDLTLDLRRGLPFASNCCRMIFSEHFLEHLGYPETIILLLVECLRVLRPGGVLMFSVPDTEWPLKDYADGSNAPYFQACSQYSWHPADCTTRLEHINYHFRQHGQHLFAYDEETAHKVLKASGFVNIIKRDYQLGLDSEHRRIGSLFMSATKPLPAAVHNQDTPFTFDLVKPESSMRPSRGRPIRAQGQS
jgi:predicted SAM-dependent methyltransferase